MEKLQKQIVGLRDDLKRETEMRSSVEKAQAALVKHLHDMETILEGEREEVRNLTTNCSNLRQDGQLLEEALKQERQKLVEFDVRYKQLNAEKISLDESVRVLEGEKRLLLDEVSIFQNQFKNLNRQLDDTKVVMDERERLQQQLEYENKELYTKNQQLMEYEAKFKASFSDKNESEPGDDSCRLNLKEVVQDRNLYHQRCQQLSYQIDELKRKLLEKDEEMEESKRSMNLELKEIKDNFLKMEARGNDSCKDKDLLVEKLRLSIACLTGEKSSLQAQLHETNLELEALRSGSRILEEENKRLLDEMSDLRNQMKSQNGFEDLLNEMTEQKTQLSYNNGLLQKQVEQLTKELELARSMSVDLQQLKSNTSAVEAKNAKLHRDLIEKRTLLQQMESELKQCKAAADRREADFELVLAARDQMFTDKQTLAAEVENIKFQCQQTTEGHKRTIASCHEDNAKLTKTVEMVMNSHATLQLTVESLKMINGQKDSQIQKLESENEHLLDLCERLTQELSALKTSWSNFSESNEAGLCSLKRELEMAKEECKRVVHAMDLTSASNGELKIKVGQLEEENMKKSFAIEELQKVRKSEHEERCQKMKAQQVSAENNLQKLRTKLDEEVKQAQLEINKVNKLLKEEKLKRKDEVKARESLNVKFSELQKQFLSEKEQSSALHRQVERLEKKEMKLKETVANLQGMAEQVSEMERVNNEYAIKTKEQAEMLDSLVSDIEDLKSTLQEVIRNRHSIGSSSRSRSTTTNVKDHRGYRPFDKGFSHEENDLRRLRKTAEKENEKNNAARTIEKARDVLTASRKAVQCLTEYAECSQNESEMEKKLLSEELRKEQSLVKRLELKLKEIQILKGCELGGLVANDHSNKKLRQP